jgi:hypothetical protein
MLGRIFGNITLSIIDREQIPTGVKLVVDLAQPR